MNIDGHDYLNFYGCGYLALAGLSEIRSAVTSALEQGVPFAQQISAASMGARDEIFDSADRSVAAACGTDAAVYFASGYFIGAVGLASLSQKFDAVVIDEHAHFNLQDAARLSGRPIHTYSHCDPNSLTDILQCHVTRGRRPLLVTDGVFGATGRIPPLNEYVERMERYGGQLFVDESHSFGVIGERGRGAAEHCGVGHFATTGATLSKALCAQGAIVACSMESARYVLTVPPLRGATRGSPLSAVAAAASLAYLSAHPELRNTLQEKTRYFRARLRAIGIDTVDSPAPVVSFKVGTKKDMLALHRRLFGEGIFLTHSTYLGTGVDGVLRCAVYRDHSVNDIDTLVSALAH
jgi:7-keto-8-aminopelargonate synthetase-like enzyme